MKKNNQPIVITAVIVGVVLIISLAFIFTREDDEQPKLASESAHELQPDPSGPVGVGDSLYPGLGNPGYDVLHYEIELDIVPLANSILAVTLITAQATEDLEAFNLDLSGLEVHSVVVDGARATFTRSGSELTIHPANLLTSGSQFEAEIRYSGSP